MSTVMLPGTVISYVGQDLNALPVNWLLCNGNSVAVEQYPALHTAIGAAFGSVSDGYFSLPDLRGMFLRGIDAGAGNDPDSSTRTAQCVAGKPGNGNTGDNVGSVQADAFANHSHALGPGNGYHGDGDYAVFQQGTSTPNATGYSGASAETRPKNVYVYYLIYAGDMGHHRPRVGGES